MMYPADSLRRCGCLVRKSFPKVVSSTTRAKYLFLSIYSVFCIKNDKDKGDMTMIRGHNLLVFDDRVVTLPCISHTINLG
jgi:hypothetical protein